MTDESLTELRLDHIRAWAPDGVPAEWGRALCRAIGDTDFDRRRPRFLHPAPESGSVYVKIYRLRPAHGLLRRLKKGRAVREGMGYLAFRERGVSTPDLMMFGERRRHGLLEIGFVATREVNAPNLAAALKGGTDSSLVENAARALARIHGAGLVHGDPLLRNFLATEPEPLPIDLSSWAEGDAARRKADLLRLLGSVLQLTDRRSALLVLERYRADAEELPNSDEELLTLAEVRSRDKTEKRERKKAARSAEG